MFKVKFQLKFQEEEDTQEKFIKKVIDPNMLWLFQEE